MKKNYIIRQVIVLMFLLAGVHVGAQPLAGFYTINSGAATGGTNFNSFTDFANAINANGVSAKVTVDVVPGSGPYNEQVLFNQISGASKINKIIINGNGNLITYNSSNAAQRYVIGMNGTDWMEINELNMEGTGTYAYVLLMYGGADNNMFTACTFSVPLSFTSSNNIPVVLSGSSTSYATASNSGNFNTFYKCVTSGGYMGICVYGNTTVQTWNTDNAFIECEVNDFYYSGIYLYYQRNAKAIRNKIQRPNRITSTTVYALAGIYNNGVMMDGNRIQDLFENMQTNTSTCYAIYGYYNPASGENPNTIRNNIVSNNRSNGPLYGIYYYYPDGIILNNTISLDHTGSTATGVTYGIYTYGNATYPTEVKNNIVSITRGGTGTKYGIYFGATGYCTMDKNIYYVNGGGATNNIAYYGGAQATLAQYQATTSQEANSFNVDPQFVNSAANNVEPTNATIDNQADFMGLLFDADMNVRNQSTPDIGALEFLTPLCSGSPGLITVDGPNFAICPGEDVSLALGTISSNAGLTYQWQESTSSQVGPFTNIPGANSILYTAPSVTTTSWYNIVMTCTAPGGSSVSAVAPVMVAGNTTSTVPYYEDFEGIGMPGRLPNCSWYSENLGSSLNTYMSTQSNNRLPNSGTSFAVFSAPTNDNYVYTNGIQMNAGVVYSAAVHYATEYLGYTNWNELSILVGPNQSTTGLVQVASVSPVMSGPYALLSGTFTVPSSGLYYVAVKADGNSGSALFLSWDDLSVTIPCQPGSPNSPAISVSASQGTICAGEAVNITANGADTYNWSNGATGPSMVANPMTSSTFTVYGTSALTGCTSQLSQNIVVNPAPIVFAISNQPTVCAGSPAYLSAVGADFYSWNNGGTGSAIVVYPNTTTSYTVIGTNMYGCTSTGAVQISVVQLPVVTAASSNPGEACKDDLITFNANGSNTYIWNSSSSSVLYYGSSINVNLNTTTVFTVTGTSANGCAGKTTITQNVSECTGITSYSGIPGLKVYPNPSSGELNIETAVGANSTFVLSDVTGRVVKDSKASDTLVTIDLSDLSAGVYYLNIQSGDHKEIVKVVKQ